MIDIRTGQKMIDYLTDERRLAQDSPEVKDCLIATAEARNIAEEMLYQGSLHKLRRDAPKFGRALAVLPMPVYYALANLHPEWFAGTDKREFLSWLKRHKAYALDPKI